MRPKFEVGEVVILQSKSQPEFNGEYTVRSVSFTGEKRPDRFHPSGQVYTSYLKDGSKGYAYVLEEIVIDSSTESGIKIEGSWAESALRKKHLPGELSFTDLMASLSSPKLITHQA
jgi:hypothetical protein